MVVGFFWFWFVCRCVWVFGVLGLSVGNIFFVVCLATIFCVCYFVFIVSRKLSKAKFISDS